MMVHKDFAQTIGREVCEKLKDLIPLHNFIITIQAAIGGKIIAGKQSKDLRRCAYQCGGGARDRKRKLLDKQKKGKARSKQFGRVEIPKRHLSAF